MILLAAGELSQRLTGTSRGGKNGVLSVRRQRVANTTCSGELCVANQREISPASEIEATLYRDRCSSKSFASINNTYKFQLLKTSPRRSPVSRSLVPVARASLWKQSQRDRPRVYLTHS
jgi:hypothetical protein